MDCEIKRAIFSFQPYKAPGSDGFHPIFFQRFWNIVGHSITSCIKDIFLARKIPPNLNTTLICLILKVSKPKNIHQFHQIDLCNTIYKTITKILFQRLKPHLDDRSHTSLDEKQATMSSSLRSTFTPCPSQRVSKALWHSK